MTAFNENFCKIFNFLRDSLIPRCRKSINTHTREPIEMPSEWLGNDPRMKVYLTINERLYNEYYPQCGLGPFKIPTLVMYLGIQHLLSIIIIPNPWNQSGGSNNV